MRPKCEEWVSVEGAMVECEEFLLHTGKHKAYVSYDAILQDAIVKIKVSWHYEVKDLDDGSRGLG